MPLILTLCACQDFRRAQEVAGTNLDRRLFEPERGTQYEVGVKLDWTERLSSTFALYQITRSNVLTTDPRDRFCRRRNDSRA